jgi:hypothetical protein
MLPLSLSGRINECGNIVRLLEDGRMAGGECYGRDKHRAIALSLDREKQSLVGSVGAYAGIDCEGATTGRYRDKKTAPSNWRPLAG